MKTNIKFTLIKDCGRVKYSGLTTRQYNIIELLENKGVLNRKQVSKAIGLSPRHTQGTVKGLIVKGLIVIKNNKYYLTGRTVPIVGKTNFEKLRRVLSERKKFNINDIDVMGINTLKVYFSRMHKNNQIRKLSGVGNWEWIG